MTFAGINYLAVAIAALAGFAVGAGWYMAFSRPWLAALGKTQTELKSQEGTPDFYLPFVISIVSLAVMAWILAGVIGHLGEVTMWAGLVSGFFIWFGFVVTTMGVNHAFQGASPALTMIDGGHWLAVLLVQGAIIGLFGV